MILFWLHWVVPVLFCAFRLLSERRLHNAAGTLFSFRGFHPSPREHLRAVPQTCSVFMPFFRSRSPIAPEVPDESVL